MSGSANFEYVDAGRQNSFTCNQGAKWMQCFLRVKNRIGQCSVYCFNAGVAFAGLQTGMLILGSVPDGLSYQFVWPAGDAQHIPAQANQYFPRGSPSFPSGTALSMPAAVPAGGETVMATRAGCEGKRQTAQNCDKYTLRCFLITVFHQTRCSSNRCILSFYRPRRDIITAKT